MCIDLREGLQDLVFSSLDAKVLSKLTLYIVMASMRQTGGCDRRSGFVVAKPVDTCGVLCSDSTTLQVCFKRKRWRPSFGHGFSSMQFEHIKTTF